MNGALTFPKLIYRGLHRVIRSRSQKGFTYLKSILADGDTSQLFVWAKPLVSKQG
jgi:hypothetical protein